MIPSAFFSVGYTTVETIAATTLDKTAAFGVGETLEYRIHYGIVNAGRAQLEVTEITQHKGHPVYHMIGTGYTTGMTDLFFHVEDRYETFIDTQSWTPRRFIRDVDEGGFEIKRNVFFSPEERTAVDYSFNSDSTFVLEEGIQDIFSLFYLARSIRVDEWKKDDIYTFPVFLDHDIFPMQFQFLGRETLDSDLGDIRCLAFAPSVQDGRVFSEEEGMTLYVSDDANRIPIRIESELSVGSIKIDITKASHLVNPLAYVK